MNIVLEIGPANGSVAYAKECVDALRDLDWPSWSQTFIKPQFYRADTLVVPDSPRYDKTSGGPDTQHEMFQTQLSYDDWNEVKGYTEQAGFGFFPSVFGIEDARQAALMGCRMQKIASGDITYHQLIKYVTSVADVIVLSTGGSTYDEIAAAAKVVQESNVQAAFMLACHLEYPTPTHRANLLRMATLRQHFPGWQIGYSDHTPGDYTAELLPVLGCQMWEKHFTIEPNTGGDHDFAITPVELQVALDDMGMTLETIGSNSLGPTDGELDARIHARRSAVAKVDIPKGTPVTKDMFDYLRPGMGVSPAEMHEITSKKKAEFAMVDISAGSFIKRSWIGNMGGSLSVS